MVEIVAQTKSVRDLLKDKKYEIDYYQRGYQWGEKQVAELISDLVSKFQEEYEEDHEWRQVEGYSRYFLGSIIISEKDGKKYIVDGQQRLTSLTLFLIFLNSLQKKLKSEGKIPKGKQLISLDALIFSSKFGRESFNLEIEERKSCMEALFKGMSNEISSADAFVEMYAKEKASQASARNLYECYQTIDANFPEDLRCDEVLLYFIEWLIERVNLVSMKTPSDEDAYTIFEAMNDRGLSLSPTDMLKSFLLANIDEDDRESVNKFWKERIRDLNYLGREASSDFFKAWLRSQYAEKTRKRDKGAKNEDYDIIGTDFHRWVGRPDNGIGLKDKDSYLKFSTIDFKFYSEQYMRLLEASKIESLGTAEAAGLEHVCYNALNGFTLQYMLLLAPLRLEDTSEEITKKIQITARYIDILLTWRLWNSRSISYNGMQYAIFLVMKEIRAYRDRSASDLGEFLCTKLQELQEEKDAFRLEGLSLNRQNRPKLHRILARITDFVETQSRMPTRFKELMGGTGTPHELEHIWAYKYYESNKNEFKDDLDFRKNRDKFGGILLLPKSLNASLGNRSYKEKLPQYFRENLLARSLHSDCYKNHPGFKRFCDSTGLKFEAIEDFKKQNIDDRGVLYQEIAKLVWNPEDLKKIAKDPQG